MREFIPYIITADDARYLVGLPSGKNKKIDHPSFEKIKETIASVAPKANWSSPAFYRVEKKGKQHPWHVDTGTRNQMAWCRYGCTILLVNDEDAGYLEYRDGHQLNYDEHFCGLAVHSSDVEHQTVHNKGRVTFLAFLK